MQVIQYVYYSGSAFHDHDFLDAYSSDSEVVIFYVEPVCYSPLNGKVIRVPTIRGGGGGGFFFSPS